MGVDTLVRDLGLLPLAGAIPTSTQTLEWNMPFKLDQNLTTMRPVFDGNPVGGIVAFPGGGQAGATLLTGSTFNRVTTVTTAGDSVLLPPAVAGRLIYLTNATSSSLAVWPGGLTDMIGGMGSAQTPFLLAGGTETQFTCTTAGTWDALFISAIPISASANSTVTTFTAGQLTGGAATWYVSNAANPGTITTRTANQMFLDTPNVQIGSSYLLAITNKSASGTLTIGPGVGVSVFGTMTVAPNATRFFGVQFLSATVLTISSIAAGSIS